MFAASPGRTVILIIAFTVLAVALLSLCCGAALCEVTPDAAPEPPSLFSMEFINVPMRLDVYPTYSETRPIELQGMLKVENLHPEDVRIYLNASIDSTWPVSIDPQHLEAPVTRTSLYDFEVFLHMPPHTYGPIESVLTVMAEARNPTRTIASERVEVQIHIIKDVDQVIDGFPGLIMVFDELRVFSGSMRLYNVLDEPQEFHLCALGEWADKIEDLDFGAGVILNGQERRKVAFSGLLSEEVEVGNYRVDLALWSPDDAGSRMMILNFTAELEVYTTRETVVDKFFEHYRYTLPITISLVVAGVLLTVRWWRGRSRRKTDQVVDTGWNDEASV